VTSPHQPADIPARLSKVEQQTEILARMADRFAELDDILAQLRSPAPPAGGAGDGDTTSDTTRGVGEHPGAGATDSGGTPADQTTDKDAKDGTEGSDDTGDSGDSGDSGEGGGPSGEEPAPPPRLDPRVLTEWVGKHIVGVLARLIPTSAAAPFWCEQWWLHPEALIRFEALRRSWVDAAAAPSGNAMAVYLEHLDHHLSVLTSPTGPFHRCRPDRHLDDTSIRLRHVLPGEDYYAEVDTVLTEPGPADEPAPTAAGPPRKPGPPRPPRDTPGTGGTPVPPHAQARRPGRRP
jgi:hypothetical protein